MFHNFFPFTEAGKLALKKAQEQGLEMAAEDSDSDKNPLVRGIFIFFIL